MKKRIVALLMAISLTFGLAGCSQKRPEKYTAAPIEISIDDDEEMPTKKEIYEKYDGYFQNYQVEYTDSYITKEEVNKHIDNASKKVTCYFDTTPYLDGDNYNIKKIINTIKENSSKYIAQNTETSHVLFGIVSSHDDILEACKLRFEISLDYILTKVLESSSNNIGEDLCNITNLKFVLADNETYIKYNNKKIASIDNYGAYIPEENVIIINKDHLINLYNSTDMAGFNNILNPVIYHLLNHVRQCNCICDKSNNKYPFNYDGVKNNTIFYESSAESIYYNEYEGMYKDNNNYNQEQDDEKILFLLSIFNNSDLNNYYNAIYDGDINKLHNFFGLQSDEEIYEFYKIIYSIDGKNCNNELLEKEDNNQVECNYKISILKLMLNKMVDYTHNNKDFTIEENISLLSLINYIINYNYIENGSTEKYINSTYLLNKEYINFLQQYYNIPAEKMNYYISDFYINKIIDEVSLSIYDPIKKDENQLSVLLEKFPNLKYILNIDLTNAKGMNALIKTK